MYVYTYVCMNIKTYTDTHACMSIFRALSLAIDVYEYMNMYVIYIDDIHIVCMYEYVYHLYMSSICVCMYEYV